MATNLSLGTKAWADRINGAWRRSAAAFIETGKLLVECKSAVKHGDFGKMLKEDLDFPERTAQRLMVIALDHRLSNPSYGTLLPKRIATLYDLTKLKDDEFDRAIKEGTIRSGMERKHVPRKRKESPAGTQGRAVSEGDLPPIAGNAADDREVGDSVVIELNPERAAVDDSKAERLFDEVDARLAAAAEPWGEPDRALQENSVDAGDAGGNPATYSDDTSAARIAGMVSYLVRASEPASLLANGLAMAIRASREILPSLAANEFPENMPLMSDELNALTGWLVEFETAFRARYGVGNDAALQARASKAAK